MAVEKTDTSPPDEAPAPKLTAGRRFTVGSNVALSILLVVGLAAVVQAIAFSVPWRFDMTSSRVNSLGEGTENLVGGLETNVRLTSLYFETDLEEEDQPRYRQSVDDLLHLYESMNRSRVVADWVNPLSDHDKYGKLKSGLLEKTTFKKEIDAYRECISKFRDELLGRMTEFVGSELGTIADLSGGFGGQQGDSAFAPLRRLLEQWRGELQSISERIETLVSAEVPQYSGATREMKSLYGSFAKTLKNIGAFGETEVARNPSLSEAQADFLSGAKSRYQPLLDAVEEESTKAGELEPLELDEILMQLAPTSNAILVQTEDDARVVDFSSVWPPMQKGMAVAKAGFKERAFKGEEKLTSAILRATHKEQTAVVFVRYGGPPLFFGGFMRGQPPAPFAMMKEHVEDANFIVREWDLKTQDDPPQIDPTPTRTIYVVLKPSPPQPSPMGQPPQGPPFGEGQRQAVLKAIGQSQRALFVAGWVPGPAGPIPSTYEYNGYLEDEWGIIVDTGTLLLQAVSLAPGKYTFARDPLSIKRLELADHDIVSGATARRVILPMCAPLNVSDEAPTDVAIDTLVSVPTRDGLWGIKNVHKYQEQLHNEYVTKVEGDLEGPFDLAVAGTSGDDKIVVISSTSFAIDEVAFAQELGRTSTGFTVYSRNPGNVTLLINSLHWLNDNKEFMNIGQPIDAAVLSIEESSTLAWVKVLTIFVWPALAFCCGLMVWWVRRR